MNPAYQAEDEPFDHEAIARSGHSRGGSSANLLNYHNEESVSDFANQKDGFYDHAGPSRNTLYDPEKPEADTKADEYSNTRNYENMGWCPPIPQILYVGA